MFAKGTVRQLYCSVPYIKNMDVPKVFSVGNLCRCCSLISENVELQINECQARDVCSYMQKPDLRDRWNTMYTWQVLSFFRLLLFQLFRSEFCNLHIDPDLNCKETNLNWNQRFISNFFYWKSIKKCHTVLVLHIIVKENISLVLKILCSSEQWWFLFRRILNWIPFSTQTVF